MAYRLKVRSLRVVCFALPVVTHVKLFVVKSPEIIKYATLNHQILVKTYLVRLSLVVFYESLIRTMSVINLLIRLKFVLSENRRVAAAIPHLDRVD